LHTKIAIIGDLVDNDVEHIPLWPYHSKLLATALKWVICMVHDTAQTGQINEHPARMKTAHNKNTQFLGRQS